MNVNDLIALLRAADAIDSGDWLMRCPAHHGASTASLEVTLSGGRYQLRCIGGCTPDEILKAALLRISPGAE